MPEQNYFNINAVSSEIDRKLLLDYMLNEEFIMWHDFYSDSTKIISRNKERIKQLSTSGIGISIEDAEPVYGIDGNFIHLPIAIFQDRNKIKERNCIDDLYKIFSGSDLKIFSSFLHPKTSRIIELKHDIEDKISKIEVRHSQSLNGYQTKQTSSVYNDSYYDSYERKLLSMFLENLNDVLINRSLSYNVSFIVQAKKGSEEVINYLKSNVILLGQNKMNAKSLNDIYLYSKKSDSIPLSYANAAQAFGISNRIRRIIRVESSQQQTLGDISIGNYIEPGINNVLQKAYFDTKVLNLGTLITGLPGTGKTNAGKLIIEQSLKKKPFIAIISPTGEWGEFAFKNSLNTIRLDESKLNINFFKCESQNVTRFYENLAMLIATGSNCGPYQNSMQNCLLSAFAKIYSKGTNPEPDHVYNEIEETIIEQHGKRSGAGVKYTKHGENIRASLEGLRQILMKPQFAYSNSASLFSLIKEGAVFDLSGLSNSIKPLIYAFLLNQVYNLCDELDINGDNELRIILCLEEAQLVFSSEDESSATIDLKDRIQNFRKTGVAIILITHNTNDISPGVRRLCQNKLYFRQSPDTAKYAAYDLVFPEAEYEKVISSLKMLGQKESAVSIITISGNSKVVSNSAFVKIAEYYKTDGYTDPRPETSSSFSTDTKINITASDTNRKFNYELYYLYERIDYGSFEGIKLTQKGLLQNKKYNFIILGERKKDNRKFEIIGGAENNIRI